MKVLFLNNPIKYELELIEVFLFFRHHAVDVEKRQVRKRGHFCNFPSEILYYFIFNE